MATSILLALMLSLGAGAAGSEESNAAESATEPSLTKTLIWSKDSDDGKYPKHRIPGIVVTKKDTVIIYCEARTGNTEYSLYDKNDWCLMDIYIQRSEDGGETFGEPIYIAYGNKTHATVNNPVIMVGNDNTLHILYCKNYGENGGGIWYRRSYDDGITWTPERSITEFAESTPHARIAFGPTHGICTRDGVLMTAVWMSQPARACVFYSTDNGETWQVSEPCSENTNETDIAQLSDGSIMVNSRSTPFRKVSVSPDGIGNWSTTRVDTQLPDPSCCGGMVSVDLEGLPYALLFVNCASTEERERVTLRCSFDDGNTYSKDVMICEYGGGYADVAVDSRGGVYVLYEVNWGNRVYLARTDFYEAFCADEAEVMTNRQTAFSLRGESGAMLVRSADHGSVTATDDGVCYTAEGDGLRRITLDLSPVTKNINVTDYHAVALRLQVKAETDAALSAELELRCGRSMAVASGENAYATLAAHGDEQVLIFDLEQLSGKDGMLRSLMLELGSSASPMAAGDRVLLSELAFFRTVDAAEQYRTEVLSRSAEESGETSEPGQSGCGAGLSSPWGLGLMLVSALPVIRRKSKKS